MRENFDYVTMPNYVADMKESTDRAVSVIDHMKKRAEKAEMMLALAVLAAGGKVEIPSEWLRDSKFTIETQRNDADMTYIIKVARVPGQSTGS
ncbi:hypothetical protein [Bradyrhizobium tunisiense]|uniref:hypothetical protein n=1 Tax=Bradyrhizobium tunisiense TaxID=3278709 RepID=UPI0035D85EDE